MFSIPNILPPPVNIKRFQGLLGELQKVSERFWRNSECIGGGSRRLRGFLGFQKDFRGYSRELQEVCKGASRHECFPVDSRAIQGTLTEFLPRGSQKNVLKGFKSF